MNGVIDSPVTVLATDSVQEVLNLCESKGYDFRTFPVVDSQKRFVGLLTGSDFAFCHDTETSVEGAMTPASNVVSRTGKVSIQEAYETMSSEKYKTLPILDEKGQVSHMYLHSDVSRIVNESEAFNVDSDGRLLVAAAIPTTNEGLERVRLMRKYLDVAVIDSANGDSFYAFKTLEAIKSEFPDLDVVVGNVSTGDSALELAIAGADGVKVGQGPGSICTTRIETGIGKPQVTAVYECARAVEDYGIPVCADGGITNNGDISVALVVGAASVMMGNRLAGTKEAPGDILQREDGSMVKLYRGMGSASAFNDSAASRERYGAQLSGPRLAEGVESFVPYRGEVASVLEMCWLGLRASFGYTKARNLNELRAETKLIRITNAGLRESHPHDIMAPRR
jgi:IMP dehydrogenase